MNEFIISKYQKNKLKKPIMIIGLPGTGNVGRITIDYLVQSLKAKKYMNIYSNTFPNSVFVEPNSTIRLPGVSVFSAKKGETEFLLVTGDMQPLEEQKSYDLSRLLVDIAKKENVKEIITIGGIGMPKLPTQPKVHCVASDIEYIKKLKDVSVTDGNKTVGFIIGVSGLVLGFASLEKMKAVSFLGETYNHPTHLGIKSSYSVLKSLIKYLNLKISLNSIEKDIKEIESHIKKKSIAKKEIAKAMRHVDVGGLKYIG